MRWSGVAGTSVYGMVWHGMAFSALEVDDVSVDGWWCILRGLEEYRAEQSRGVNGYELVWWG